MNRDYIRTYHSDRELQSKNRALFHESKRNLFRHELPYWLRIGPITWSYHAVGANAEQPRSICGQPPRSALIRLGPPPKCPECSGDMVSDLDGLTGADWFCANNHRAVLIFNRRK